MTGGAARPELRLVFMGTAGVSATVLRSLLAAPDIELAGVVTPPDRPRGRQRRLSPCEVKVMAAAAGVPVWSTPKVNDPETLERIAAWRPAAMVVVAFGQFLGARLLELPPLGCLNVHFSLLPALRGAAPVQWALLNGDRHTGVSVMLMDRGMDSGAILAQRSVAISPDETAGELQARLAGLGAELLLETLPAWQTGRLEPRPQDHARATLAPKLEKSDGRLDWSLPAARLARRVRAFNPWPGTFTTVPAAAGIKAHRLGVNAAVAEAIDQEPCGPPGAVCAADSGGLRVLAGGGVLRLLEVQPEGGRVMSAGAYLQGRPLRPGLVLGGSSASRY